MFKNVSSFWERWITRLLLAAIVAFLLFMLFSGCNAAKQSAKKDEKAVNRVNANAKLQDTVMKRWFETHPQDTGRKIREVPGPTITVPVPVFMRDTAAERKMKDSLSRLTPNCKEAAENGFDLGYEQAVIYFKANPVTVKCPPSTHTVETDYRAIDRANAATKDRELQNAYLAGQMAQKDAQIRSEQGQKSKQTVWVIIIGAALGLSLFMNVKTLIPSFLKKIKP